MIHSPATLSTDPPTPLSTLRVLLRESLPRFRTLLSIERSESFPDCLLVRFLWQRRGLKHSFKQTSLPKISSTSPCRLQPIYYSCVSATIRRSKILVHTPSVTPDTLVYKFDYSRSRGIGSKNHRDNREGAAPSAATPPASARGAAAKDTKRPPLAERNHPRAVTILQSPNGSNID